MLSHEILISKGFELNEYPEGRYYEFETTKDEQIEKILTASKIGYDTSYLDEKVILQLREDFSNKVICVECNVWDLNSYEFDKILKEM